MAIPVVDLLSSGREASPCRAAGQAAGVEPPPTVRPIAGGSAWSPLRIAAFRALWLAQLGSMIGTWMQTVGAQWLLIDEPNASTLVALVQTASLLPMLLLALPAGVLADSFDRRRLLIGTQLVTFTVGAVLTGLALTGDMPPALLLTFTFLLGAGAAISMPPWQALIPDIVPRHDVRAAAALGAVSMNLARAVGPALAGFLITQFPVGIVFAVNAVSYAVMAAVLLRWGPRSPVSGDVPERFVPALRAGARYVRHSRIVRRLLLRSALFVLPGTALWALLPLVATRRLGLSSGGYGLLLAALGIGAVTGAVVLPEVAARLSTGVMVLLASLIYAAAQTGMCPGREPRAGRRTAPARGSGLARRALHPRRRDAGLPARLGPGTRVYRCSRSCSWADRRSAHSSGGWSRSTPASSSRSSQHPCSWCWARRPSGSCHCTTPPASTERPRCTGPSHSWSPSPNPTRAPY